MSACPHHTETLMLDIFGELSEDRSAAWEKHLSSCPDCAAEKNIIDRTLNFTKTALEAPPLGDAEASAMRERVIRNLTTAPSFRDRKPGFFFSRAFVPTFASVCVLLFVLGLLASKLMTGPERDNKAHFAVLQEQLPREDIEVINNMDQLRDLDALNKLSRAIDRSQPPSPYNNIQGKDGHDKKPIYS